MRGKTETPVAPHLQGGHRRVFGKEIDAVFPAKSLEMLFDTMRPFFYTNLQSPAVAIVLLSLSPAVEVVVVLVRVAEEMVDTAAVAVAEVQVAESQPVVVLLPVTGCWIGCRRTGTTTQTSRK